MGDTFSVRGRVLDEHGDPLPHVGVIVNNRRAIETEADGTFTVDGLEGSTVLSAREGDCYVPWTTVGTEDEVELRMRRGATWIARVLADGVPLPGATVVFANAIQAVTDERGIATIRGVGPRPLQIPDQVVVFAEGRATRFLSVTVPDDPGGVIEQPIELAPGAEVSGRVLDRSGAPVSNLRVTLRDETSKPVAEVFPQADGTWQVAMPAGRYHVEAGMRARKTIEPITIDCDGQTAQRDLVLQVGDPRIPHGRIAGVVVDECGRPAEGVRVTIVPPAGSFSSHLWFGRTGTGGHFETPELDVGDVDVLVAWDRVRGEVRHRARVGDVSLTLVLPSGATLVGRALLDGAPVPYFGYCVDVATTPFHVYTPTGVRAPDGRFTALHVPPGAWRVALLAPGCRLVTTDEIVVTGNETIDLGDLALARGHRVTGVVRDRSGAPVAGARVLVGRFSAMEELQTMGSRLERWFRGQYQTTTDDTGRYVLDGISVHSPPGYPEVIRATHPSAGESLVHELPACDATIDFVLLGRGRIDGVVDGQAKHASVLAVRHDEPGNARQALIRGGRFAFEVPPGDYAIQVSPNQNATTVRVLADQTVRATIG